MRMDDWNNFRKWPGVCLNEVCELAGRSFSCKNAAVAALSTLPKNSRLFKD